MINTCFWLKNQQFCNTCKLSPFSAANFLASGLAYILSSGDAEIERVEVADGIDVVGVGGDVTDEGDGGTAADGEGRGEEGEATVSSLKSLNAATLASSWTMMHTSLPMGTFFVPAGTRIFAK